jgi:hypothetical protein
MLAYSHACMYIILYYYYAAQIDAVQRVQGMCSNSLEVQYY